MIIDRFLPDCRFGDLECQRRNQPSLDLIRKLFDDPLFVQKFENSGALRVRGVEANASYSHGSTDLFGNYTYASPIRTETTKEILAPDRTRSDRLGDIAAHKLNLGIQHRWRQLDLSARMNVVGARPTWQSNPLSELPRYSVANVAVSYVDFLPGFTAQLVINNIFSSSYADPGVRTADNIRSPRAFRSRGDRSSSSSSRARCSEALALERSVSPAWYSRRPHAQLRVRHRSSQVHRVSRVHDRLQSRARDSDRRQSLLGQDRRERHLPRHPPILFPRPLQPCDDAPCARICPTNALYRRRDGIVDLHGDSCIGCRACMVACPYDQLFIDPNTHTAEKCNFCANRVENQLLPACVSVCPTECRIFGDLDDPSSEVAKIAQMEAMQVRKPEKGTLPKVFYLGADDSVIRPEAGDAPVHLQGRPGAVAPAGHRRRRIRSTRARRASTTTRRT
jgi:Fe-S-cluster-containing dehydrogenase component